MLCEITGMWVVALGNVAGELSKKAIDIRQAAAR
jgi:hypothetical protein